VRRPTCFSSSALPRAFPSMTASRLPLIRLQAWPSCSVPRHRPRTAGATSCRLLLATIIRRNHCNPPIGSEKPRGGFDLIWDASHSVKDILLHVDATPDSTVRVQTAH